MTGMLQRKRRRRAIDLKDQGRLEEAETILAALVASDPGFAEAWLELGNVRFDRAEGRLAFEAFTNAAGFIETAAEASTALGRLATPGPGDPIRRRNFRKALLAEPAHLPAMTDLAALGDGAARRWFPITAVSVERGESPFRELINRGKIGIAMPLARIAAVLRPGLPATQHDLGALAFRMENLEGKARHFKRAAVLLPNHLDAQIETVDALFQAEDFAGAEVYGRRALAIDRASPLALFWLGRILRYLGRFDEARSALDEARRRDERFALRIRVVEQGINPADFNN
jgi:tetratricopeptide (TPR) repeat protein